MNIDKIKQVIQLQREIKTENENIIEIDMMDERVLVRPELFKEIFENKEHSVHKFKDIFIYDSEFEGIKFTANNRTPIFDFISENINS